MKLRNIVIGALASICTATTAAACSLTLGVVPQFEHRRTLEIWNPIIERLRTATDCEIKFVGALSIPEFESHFKSGVYDIAYVNPYHSVQAYDSQGYLPLIRSGKRQLQGILTVPKDSNLNTVEDLNGSQIAFPAPNALGASLLMRAELTNIHGVDFIPKYVGTHTSVYLNVFKKLTAAGGGVQRTFDSQDDRLKDNLRVLYRTSKVASHPVIAHPRIGEDVAAAIVAEMMTIQETNPDLLAGIPMKAPVEATLDDYAPLRDLGLENFID